MTTRFPPSDRVPVRALAPLFAIAFGLTWGLAAILIAFTEQIEAWFGALSGTHPLFILAVWSPAIAAVLIVLRYEGASGLGRFLGRLALWRMPLVWWVFLVLGIPAIFYVGAALKGTLGEPFPFAPWHRVLPAMALALIIGPMEELGWRGVGLPLLQRRMAPFWATLVLGFVWAVWHLPAFFLSGSPQSDWSFPAFFGGVIGISFIITPMFNAARGSLLVPVLFHFQTNGPAWPDAQPWDTLVVLVVAVVVIWLNRRTMFRRGAGAVDVVPPPATAPRLTTDALQPS